MKWYIQQKNTEVSPTHVLRPWVYLSKFFCGLCGSSGYEIMGWSISPHPSHSSHYLTCSSSCQLKLIQSNESFSGSWPSLIPPMLPYLMLLSNQFGHIFKTSYPYYKYLWGLMIWKMILTRKISLQGNNVLFCFS